MNSLLSIIQERKHFFQCHHQIEEEVQQIFKFVRQFEATQQKIQKIRNFCFYDFSDYDLSEIDKFLEEIMHKDINHMCRMMDLSKIIGTPYYGHSYPQDSSNSHKHLLEMISSDFKWIRNGLDHFEKLMKVNSNIFYDQPILEIPAQKFWNTYLQRESECFGDCDHCNKMMYPHRTGYLKSWLNIYIKNQEQIKHGKVIPKLKWLATESAKEFKLGDYHWRRCDSKESVKKCPCDIACLLRAMYYASDDLVVKSLDQILPVYLKMKKYHQKLLSLCVRNELNR